MAWPLLPPDELLLNACTYLCGDDSISLLLGLLCFSAMYALCPCNMFQTIHSLPLPSLLMVPSGGVAWPVTRSQLLPQTDFFSPPPLSSSCTCRSHNVYCCFRSSTCVQVLHFPPDTAVRSVAQSPSPNLTALYLNLTPVPGSGIFPIMPGFSPPSKMCVVRRISSA